MPAYRSFSISLILTVAFFMFALDFIHATSHNIDRSIIHRSNRVLKKRIPGPLPQPASDSDNSFLQNDNPQQVSPNATISGTTTSASSSSSPSITSTNSNSTTSTSSSPSSGGSASVSNTSISLTHSTSLSTASKSSDVSSLSSSILTSTQSLSSSTLTNSGKLAITTQSNLSPADGLVSPSSILETDIVSSLSSSQTSSAAVSTPVASAAISKPVLTIIIIASCIGGAISIWTIIRKWKFRPSSQFEDRMQPIDWQSFGNEKSSSLRRSSSNASHGSFHSGSEHEHSRSFIQNRLSDLPAHDFTAGPAHLVSFPSSEGYVDLARDTSPQCPTIVMNDHGASLNRSYNYTDYFATISAAYGAQHADDHH